MKLEVTTIASTPDRPARYLTRLITTCECDDCALVTERSSAVEMNEWLSNFFNNYDMDVETITPIPHR